MIQVMLICVDLCQFRLLKPKESGNRDYSKLTFKDIILKTLQSVTHYPWALPRTSYFLLSGCLRTCLPPFNSLGKRAERQKSKLCFP